MEEKQWYVIHTYAGYENKVKANLEKRIESMNMQDKIFRIIVPVEDEVQIKGGKKKITHRKIYPGYVLVEMVITDDSWHMVRSTPGVTGFVGSGSRPVPLQPHEVRQILRQMGVEEPRPRIQ
ncbi:MAG: transcription termination/antitermination factor NusG, partial [Clostridia bacterium]|nr:transcription termination/antitermination factor NusG [Clostridia bacterium]